MFLPPRGPGGGGRRGHLMNPLKKLGHKNAKNHENKGPP